MGTGTGGTSGTSPSRAVKFVGNITTKEKVDPSGLRFSDYWDQLTPEHAGIWGAVQSRAGGAFNWTTLDTLYKYAEEKGLAFHEDSFVWGSQQPSGTIGESEVKAWMQAFCQRYPKTRSIEVVKEPPPHVKPSYVDNIGGGTNGDWKWIANAFQWARQACPDALLILSDYNTVQKPDETQYFIDIVKAIQAAGAPIDGIGAEVFNTETVAAGTLKTLLDKLHADTGLPVTITAYRINEKDDEQLALYQAQFPVLWQPDYVRGITLWGWICDGSLSNSDSGLVKDGAARPAMKWLMGFLGRPSP